MDFFKRENCNKAMCKTCVFQTNGEAINLSPERKNEIETYLRTFKSSHICHTTNKTCYGGLLIQAEMMYRLGVIAENSVDSALNKAEEVLKFD